MDINPLNAGHALAIPKAHAANLFELSPFDLAATANAARRVALALRRAVAPGGVSFMQANGPGAAQSVPHFHLHVIPRVTGDDLRMNQALKLGDMDTIPSLADTIKSEMQ